VIRVFYYIDLYPYLYRHFLSALCTEIFTEGAD